MSNLHTLVFYATPEHECSYLPDQLATTMFVDPKAQINHNIYSQLSALGFRRSGDHYYRPHCDNCSACVPVRVLARQFQPTRSQKRVASKNAKLVVQSLKPDFHEDHYLIYEKYINQRHRDGDMFPPSRDQYRSFLVNGHSCTEFIEFSVDDQVLGVAVVDALVDGLSAMYTFFDPDFESLSLGTYAVLWQIEEAKRRQLDFVYLGYFIGACRKMSYKTAFKPFEARLDEHWLSIEQMQNLVEHQTKNTK